MDLKPPEQPGQLPTEQEPKPILLEKAVAKALGRGLKQQIFTNAEMDKIKNAIGNFSKTNEKNVLEMAGAHREVSDLLSTIETAKEVKLIPFAGVGWKIDCSPEKDLTMESLPKDIPLDPELLKKLISALSHSFLNRFTTLDGSAMLIEMSSADPTTKKEAKSIRDTCASMLTKFKTATKDEQQMGDLLRNVNCNINTSQTLAS